MRKSVKLGSLVLAMLASAQSARADLIVKPYTWTPGQVLPASELNSNFNVIYNNYNGSITNQNIKNGALIDPAKMDLTKAYGPILRAATNQCFGVGTSGDSVARLSLWTDGSARFSSGSATADASISRLAAGSLQLLGSSDYGTLRLKRASFYKSSSDTQPAIDIQGDTTTAQGISVGPGGSTAPPVQMKYESSTGGLAVVDSANPTTTYKPIDVSAIYVNGIGPLTPASFGGTGAAGTVNQNNATFTGTTRIDAGLFNQIPGTTVSIEDGAFNLNTTKQMQIAGTIATTTSSSPNGGLGGGTGSNSLRGAQGGGAGGGASSMYDGAGGNGGASFLFGGGGGGHNGTSGQAGTETQQSGSFYAMSGGGSGGNSIVMTATSNGGAGGSGKHQMIFQGVTGIILFSATQISSQGTTGSAGVVSTTTNAAGGGGGGAGGNVLIASQSNVSLSSGAAINLSGGNGGNAGRNSTGNAGGGGGGASGTLIGWTPVWQDTGATITLNGGSGGSGVGSGASGQSGDNGTLVQITGTPNNPLVVHFLGNPDKYRGYMRSIAQIHQATGKTGPIQVPHNMMVQIASEGDSARFCKLMTERSANSSETTCLTIGDNSVSEALANQS